MHPKSSETALIGIIWALLLTSETSPNDVQRCNVLHNRQWLDMDGHYVTCRPAGESKSAAVAAASALRCKNRKTGPSGGKARMSASERKLCVMNSIIIRALQLLDDIMISCCLSCATKWLKSSQCTRPACQKLKLLCCAHCCAQSKHKAIIWRF